MSKPSPKTPKLEFAPDAWERFESLVKAGAKMGHQPHKPSPPQRKTAVKAKKVSKRVAKR